MCAVGERYLYSKGEQCSAERGCVSGNGGGIHVIGAAVPVWRKRSFTFERGFVALCIVTCICSINILKQL